MHLRRGIALNKFKVRLFFCVSCHLLRLTHSCKGPFPLQEYANWQLIDALGRR